MFFPTLPLKWKDGTIDPFLEQARMEENTHSLNNYQNSEASVPVDTDPGPPEEGTLDSVVLSGRSENTQVNEVWHWTDLDSLLVKAAAA